MQRPPAKAEADSPDLTAARAREAATREILDLISRTRGDADPVFSAILRLASDLCATHSSGLFMGRKGDSHQRLAAHFGTDPATDALYDSGKVAMDPELSFVAEAIVSGKVVHVADLRDTDRYRRGIGLTRSTADDSGIRTTLIVPLMTAEGGIGAIALDRKEVRPFDADEIALVEAFAAQAVIAIENARQFRELQERLAREAATREILEVISQSRDDERPVFDVVLRKAAELCNASMADLEIISEDRSHSVMVAHWGDTLRHHVVGATVWPMESELASAMYMHGGRVVHVRDLADTDLYRSGDPVRVADVDGEGIRTFLAVPLYSGGKTIGCIVLYRREVNPFGADQIALIETFAAQAVIAIENVRQFRELQERLAREAATREILEVISQSRDDERPVFDAILQNAARLCGAAKAGLNLGRRGDTHVRLAATIGWDAVAGNPFKTTPSPMDRDQSYTARSILDREIIHLPDMANAPLYLEGLRAPRLMVDEFKVRSMLMVPLLQGEEAIGAVALHRLQPEPFTPSQIDLVRSFAAQAVIAIENVRQFRELQTRLAREAATREILEVISQSRDDEGPVFDMILRNVARLCGTSYTTLSRVNPERTHLVYTAHWGTLLKSFEVGEDRWPLDSPLQIVRSVTEARALHTPDLADSDLYRAGDPVRTRLVEDGVRSFLTLPLITPDLKAIGCIALGREEVRPFTPDEIALVETFAAQAVIAIENVRQFRELQERLAREAATREILEVISQSRDDDKPVFDVVLRKAAELCHGPMASLFIISEDRSHSVMVAEWGHHDVSGVFLVGETVGPLDSDYAHSTCMREGRVVHLEDMADSDLYRSGDPIRTAAVDQEGLRTFLAVPLFSGGRTVGCIAVYRREVKPFTADEIALVETFAAQAVIAIENVRQFRELQTRLEREAATREILEVISQSRDDDRPVFDVILRNAIRLCDGDTSAMLMGRKDDPRMTLVAWRDRAQGESVTDDEMIARMNATEMRMDPSVHVSAQAIVEARNIHVVDVRQHPSYLAGEPSYTIMGDALGTRSSIVVPLIDAKGALGTVHVHRKTVRPFTPDEIALVETFAAQAVIAIENVRQFRELQTRLAREAATREILEVISQSR
ncbi:MAG: GAF domain-containing protein, partial [Paracoccaceae bacterium]